MLLEVERDIALIGECASGTEAVEMIRRAAPDLVFLDVQMPGGDGFEVVDRVGREQMPVTVFVTSHDGFGLRAFEAQAADYLLKPLDSERFQRTLRRVRALTTEPTARNPAAEPAAHLERFRVRNGSRIVFVDADRVDWIGAEGNYLRLYSGKQSHLIRETLSHVESRLDPRRFMRIHRSTIVNLDRVRALESVFQREYLLILEDGTRLPSSSSYRSRLESALLQD